MMPKPLASQRAIARLLPQSSRSAVHAHGHPPIAADRSSRFGHVVHGVDLGAFVAPQHCRFSSLTRLSHSPHDFAILRPRDPQTSIRTNTAPLQHRSSLRTSH